MFECVVPLCNVCVCLHRVGKSSFMNRYVNHRFTNMYRATIGTDFLCKTLDIDGHTVNLQVAALSTAKTTTHTCRNINNVDIIGGCTPS